MKTEFKLDMKHWLIGVNGSTDGTTRWLAIHFGPFFCVITWKP